MSGFKQHTGLVVPLDTANIDTDAIIPKQFLQKVNRIGFGKHLFHDWRFLDSCSRCSRFSSEQSRRSYSANNCW